MGESLLIKISELHALTNGASCPIINSTAFDPMGSNFHCIIRTAGTTGPQGVQANFFCNTKQEGKAKLAATLATLKDQRPEVQIFDMRG